MNKPNNPTSYNKSKKEPGQIGSFHLHILLFCLYWVAKLHLFSCHWFIFLLIPSVITVLNSYACSTVTLSSFIYPVNGGWKKATGLFWKLLQKPGSVFTGWGRAGLFYNVVLSVTWQLTAVQLSPCLANSPVIFSIWKILGVTSVCDCWLKPDGGFPINKCTGSIYTDCGTWRHNTHDTLFSGQSCHKSL